MTNVHYNVLNKEEVKNMISTHVLATYRKRFLTVQYLSEADNIDVNIVLLTLFAKDNIVLDLQKIFEGRYEESIETLYELLIEALERGDNIMKSITLIRKNLIKAVEEARREGDRDQFLIIFSDGSWAIRNEVKPEKEAEGWLNLEEADFNASTATWMVEQGMYNKIYNFDKETI